MKSKNLPAIYIFVTLGYLLTPLYLVKYIVISAHALGDHDTSLLDLVYVLTISAWLFGVLGFDGSHLHKNLISQFCPRGTILTKGYFVISAHTLILCYSGTIIVKSDGYDAEWKTSIAQPKIWPFTHSHKDTDIRICPNYVKNVKTAYYFTLRDHNRLNFYTGVVSVPHLMDIIQMKCINSSRTNQN